MFPTGSGYPQRRARNWWPDIDFATSTAVDNIARTPRSSLRLCPDRHFRDFRIIAVNDDSDYVSFLVGRFDHESLRRLVGVAEKGSHQIAASRTIAQFQLDSACQRREYPEVLHKVTRAIVCGGGQKRKATGAAAADTFSTYRERGCFVLRLASFASRSRRLTRARIRKGSRSRARSEVSGSPYKPTHWPLRQIHATLPPTFIPTRRPYWLKVCRHFQWNSCGDLQNTARRRRLRNSRQKSTRFERPSRSYVG
jgi:hypothetical protein